MSEPVSGDGVVDLPGGVPMAAEATQAFSSLLEKAMLEQSNVFTAQQNRATAGDAAVAELVRNGFAAVSVNSIQLVGAKAAQTLEADRVAQEVLQQRAVRDQPASSAFAKPVTA